MRLRVVSAADRAFRLRAGLNGDAPPNRPAVVVTVKLNILSSTRALGADEEENGRIGRKETGHAL
jgi:hypothetical protein